MYAEGKSIERQSKWSVELEKFYAQFSNLPLAPDAVKVE